MIKHLALLSVALLALPSLALADSHENGDGTSWYAMPFGGLEKRPDADTRGTLNTKFGPISGNAITSFDDAGWVIGGEAGAVFAPMERISIRAGLFTSYSMSGLAELRPINAAFGMGPSVTLLPTFPLEGDISTLKLGVNARVGWENSTIVTPHVLVSINTRRTEIDIKRFGGVSINAEDKADDWHLGGGLGLGMTIDLTGNMALMVEGAYSRSFEDPRINLTTPAGALAVDLDDEEHIVTTGLVISF